MNMSARDRQVAIETVRPRSECHHCNPGVDTPSASKPLTIEQVSAALGLAELDPEVWYNTATSFTCMEAEAIAEFLGVFHDEQTAAEFMLSHALGDDPEDDRHAVENGEDGKPKAVDRA